MRAALLICCLTFSPLTQRTAQCGPRITEPVALYTSFQEEMPAAAVKAMRKELDWISAPIGLKVAWRRFSDPTVYPPVVRLAVVHFKGRCDTEDLTIYREYAWKLGWTHSVDGRVIPYTDIFCDAIRAYIAPLLQWSGRKQRDAIFGRAVGRVLAHELYHIFAETRRHSSNGLARAYCTPEELVSDNFHFASKELHKLRVILAKTVISAGEKEEPAEGQQTFISYGCVGCHGPHAEGTTEGPTIEIAKVPGDVPALRSKLNDTHSTMQQRARNLGFSWSEINGDELRSLLKFLKTKPATVLSE